jgi:CheY-like chemotaxis protein
LDLDEVAEATDLMDMYAQAEGSPPDVILLDWNAMDEPIETIRQTLQQLDIEPGVILFNVAPNDQQTALSAGADTVVKRGDPPKKILIAIEKIRLRKGDDQYA